MRPFTLKQPLRGEHYLSVDRLLHRAIWQRQYVAKKRINGICTECSVKAEANSSLCTYHRNRKNKNCKETTEWKKQQGYCVHGGCWEKRGTTVRCEPHRLANKQNMLAVRQRKIKEGNCIISGCWEKVGTTRCCEPHRLASLVIAPRKVKN